MEADRNLAPIPRASLRRALHAAVDAFCIELEREEKAVSDAIMAKAKAAAARLRAKELKSEAKK